MKPFHIPIRTVVWVLAAIAVGATAPRVGVAGDDGTTDPVGPPGSVGYEIGFATDFDLLMDPNDPVAQHFAGWKTPAQMASLRAAPMIRITNRSDSELSIESLRIDLGVQTHFFDSIAVLETPDTGAASLMSHSDMGFGGDTSSFIMWDFSNGLAPGDSFTFQVRLVPPELSNVLPDFRDVLWQNEDAAFAADRSDNGLVSVVYRDFDDPSSDPLTFEPPPTRLFEYPIANSIFPQDENGASGSTVVFAGGHMQTVEYVNFTQVSVIPEPSGGLLMAVGVVGLTTWRRRRRAT